MTSLLRKEQQTSSRRTPLKYKAPFASGPRLGLIGHGRSDESSRKPPTPDLNMAERASSGATYT